MLFQYMSGCPPLPVVMTATHGNKKKVLVRVWVGDETRLRSKIDRMTEDEGNWYGRTGE